MNLILTSSLPSKQKPVEALEQVHRNYGVVLCDVMLIADYDLTSIAQLTKLLLFFFGKINPLFAIECYT